MPLPKPKPNERKNEFVSRCVGDKTMKNEYPDPKQRTAVCFSQWREVENIEDIDDFKDAFIGKKKKCQKEDESDK